MTISLQQLRIASPCTASWDDMAGDEHSRFCSECRLNVYNLSAMTQTQAEELIRIKEGRVCVRFYQRSDGTVLTRDCPVGLAALRKRTRWMLVKVAALFALGVSAAAWAINHANPHRDRGSLTQAQPLQTFARWLSTPQPPVPLMGSPAPPPALMGRPASASIRPSSPTSPGFVTPAQR